MSENNGTEDIRKRDEIEFLEGGVVKKKKKRRDMSTFLFELEEIEALKLILSNSENLVHMLEWYNYSEKGVDPNKPFLSEETTGLQDIKTTSVRISKKIHEDFNKTCRQHKEFTKTELINIALDEFNKKYYKKRKRSKLL